MFFYPIPHSFKVLVYPFNQGKHFFGGIESNGDDAVSGTGTCSTEDSVTGALVRFEMADSVFLSEVSK
jgi:hypothetical protein